MKRSVGTTRGMFGRVVNSETRRSLSNRQRARPLCLLARPPLLLPFYASSSSSRAFASYSTVDTMEDLEFWRNKTETLLNDKYIWPKDAKSAIFWWAEQRTKEGIDTAWKILERVVKDTQRSGQSSDTVQLTKWLNFTVNAWRLLVEDDLQNRLMKAEQVLEKTSFLAPYLLPNTQTFNMIIDARILQGPGAAEFAEEVLKRMQQESTNNPLMSPDAVTYSLVVNAWRKSGSPEKAEAVLQNMNSVKPNTISFNTAIAAWADSKDAAAGKRAEGLLKKMRQLSRQEDSQVKPDVVSYISAITAWANSKDPSAGRYAEALLRQMHEDFDAGNTNVKPNTVIFTAVITAWANSRDGAAGRRAERLLEQMQDEYDEGNTDLKADTICFSAAMDAWAKSGDHSAGNRAELLLQQMEDMYESGDSNVKPDAFCYLAVISAWANSRHSSAGKRAELLLQRMQKQYEAGNAGAKPERMSCTATISAWAKSGDPSAGKRGERILRQMQKLSKAGEVHIKPDTVSYNAAISAWAYSQDPHRVARAEALLREMNEMHRAGVRNVKPDAVTYTSIIQAWRRSNYPSAAGKQTDKYLQEMKALNIKPNKYVYSSAIKAWEIRQDEEAQHRVVTLKRESKQLGQKRHRFEPLEMYIAG